MLVVLACWACVGKNNINFSVVNTYEQNVNACENIWIKFKQHNNKKSEFAVNYRHPTYQILISRKLRNTA